MKAKGASWARTHHNTVLNLVSLYSNPRTYACQFLFVTFLLIVMIIWIQVQLVVWDLLLGHNRVMFSPLSGLVFISGLVVLIVHFCPWDILVAPYFGRSHWCGECWWVFDVETRVRRLGCNLVWRDERLLADCIANQF